MSVVRIFVVLAIGAVLAGATCNARPLSDLPKGIDPSREGLAAGDIIELQVFNEAELSGQHQIEATGSVRLPLLGDVPAAGQSLEELQHTVQTLYNEKYLKNAQISIKLVESTTLTVYVLGQVARPGPYPFRGKMTLLRAVALAGGMTKLSDEGHVQLTRVDEHEERVLVLVDFPSIRTGTNPDVDIQPGDVIFIPETPL